MKYNKILKPKKFDNFTIIPSSIFRHKNITVGATGLFAYLFSHKAEQEITIQFICGHFKESKGAIGRKLNELIDAGYIVRERVTDKGKFKGFNYILKAKPKPQKPKPQKPKPQNEPQSNINNIHNYCINVDLYENGANNDSVNQLIGNVWEWCYEEIYPYNNFTIDYVYREMSYPYFGKKKICRGGCFCVNDFLINSKYRNAQLPDCRTQFIGFRICSDSI